jgi:hypothetical protein
MSQLEAYKNILISVLESKKQDLLLANRYMDSAKSRDKTIEELQAKIKELEAK